MIEGVADQGAATGLLTVLFTDIVGSTELTARLGDEEARVIRDSHDLLVRSQLLAYGGREVQTTGDGFLITFRSVRQAVACAHAVQRAQLEHNKRHPDQALNIRVGLHAGDVSPRDDGLFGSAVNFAARVTAQASSGEILVSEVVKQLAGTIAEMEFRDRGRYHLKGFPDAWRLYELRWSAAPASPAWIQSPNQPANLPIRLTSFVGRETDLSELRRLLEMARLLTVAGAGGMGKTRLALAAAEKETNGAWFVDLTPLGSVSLIWDAIATAVGLHETASAPAHEAVCLYLGERTGVVLLDNCEHVVGAAGEVASTLLRRCAHLRVLATSREPLRIEGELLWRIPAMPEGDAIELFQARAGANKDDATEAVVPVELTALLHHLDFMPLAIELAAAQARAMTLQDLIERLDKRLQLLTRGDRQAAPRQQTLLATLQWSYDLLDEPERQMLARLSVFVGGFTLEAAEQVCAYGGAPASLVPELVTRLVEKSLVQLDASGARGRYRLLETVRAFALDQLQGNLLPRLRDRHADYYVASFWPEDASRYDGRNVNALELDQSNVRGALDWSWGRDDDRFVRLFIAMNPLWLHRLRYREGSHYGLRAASLQVAPPLRIEALSLLSWYQAGLGDLGGALQTASTAVGIAEELGDPLRMATALDIAADHQSALGSAPEYALELYAEAVHQARIAGDPRTLAACLNGWALGSLYADRMEAAAQHADEALELLATVATDSFLYAAVLDTRANISLASGDRARAVAEWRDALQRSSQQNDLGVVPYVLEGLAQVALAADPARALRLAAGVARIRREIGIELLPVDESHTRTWLERALTALPEDEAKDARRRGEAMRMEELVAEALAVLP